MSDFVIDSMSVEGGFTASNVNVIGGLTAANVSTGNVDASSVDVTNGITANTTIVSSGLTAGNINVVNGVTAADIHADNFFTGDGSKVLNISHQQLVDINGGTAGDYYHLTQPEHQILSAGATSFSGTTIGGTADALVPDDGVIATGTRVLQDDGNWGSIGGAKSMILTFSSEGSPELSTSSTTYTRLAAFIYAGSDAVGAINILRVNAWRVGGSSIDVRIVDLTTALTVAEINITSAAITNLSDMGTISNIPTTETVFEVQGKKNGGGAKLNMASIEIEY